jgi:hypothetical protein
MIALSLAPNVNIWLANSRHPRILHLFDSACNLINERREVLSIVTPEIGNGPFNLVINNEVLFSEHLSLESPVSISANQLNPGQLIISLAEAKLWDPQPDWDRLHSIRDIVINQLTKLPFAIYEYRGLDISLAKNARDFSTTSLQFSNPLTSSLANADLSSSIAAAKKLAGLGIGLTPAGDDFIMGALYAAWIIHPREIASGLADEIAESAAELTTSLSAAWIRSAGRGEAGELWHKLFEALTAGVESDIQRSVEQILSVGETSGMDALAGFFGVFANVIDRPAVPKSP